MNVEPSVCLNPLFWLLIEVAPQVFPLLQSLCRFAPSSSRVLISLQREPNEAEMPCFHAKDGVL